MCIRDSYYYYYYYYYCGMLLRLSSRYEFRRLASQLAPLPGQGLRLPRGVGALAWEGGLIKS